MAGDMWGGSVRVGNYADVQYYSNIHMQELESLPKDYYAIIP
jgi:hypothetical protein